MATLTTQKKEPEVRNTEVIRVKATQQGYYKHLLRYGPQSGRPVSVFDLTPHEQIDPKTKKKVWITAAMQFSHAWMERVDGKPAPDNKREMPDDIIVTPSVPMMGQPEAQRPMEQVQESSDELPTGDQEII